MIYCYDTEAPGLVEEAEHWWCLVFKELSKNKFHCFCDMRELANFDQDQIRGEDDIRFYPTQDYLKLINSPKTKGLICHNQLSFDLELMQKLDGIEFDYTSINGRLLFLADSLIMSRYLNPERQLPKGCPKSIYNTVTGKKDIIRPHSLDAWAYRTGIAKPIVHDWRNQPLNVYITRCIEDTKNNEATYFMLLDEMKDVAISNGEKKGDWKLPIRMAHKSSWLMYQQEKTGVKFDKEGAEKLIVRIDKEMKEIEEEVEPTLGERVLPQGQQPVFPASPFKKPFDYKVPFKSKGGLKKAVDDYLELIDIPEIQREDYICSMLDKEVVEGNSIIKNYIEKRTPKTPLSSLSIFY